MAKKTRMWIDGELFRISPESWALFESFWGDKAYREAAFVEQFEELVRKLAVTEITGEWTNPKDEA